MIFKDVPANGLFFCTYEFLQNEFKKRSKQGDINLMGALLAGGLSGMSYWLVGMPADVLKSRLQSAPEGTYKHGLRSVFQELLAKDGIFGLYTGAAPVLLRAFPANAACFFGIELANKVLEYFFPDL